MILGHGIPLNITCASSEQAVLHKCYLLLLDNYLGVKISETT